jgi:glycosyltransferase involved in cell wall biosynthesis
MPCNNCSIKYHGSGSLVESLVSICLPTFNGADFLPKAIESALAQTHKNFELLISDDCSTDKTSEIIEDYAKQDPRIHHWKNDRRLGLFANYNSCFARAKGDYIKPHAQDDLWEPTLIERSLSILQKHENVALVSSRRKVIDEKGRAIPHEGIITAVDLFGIAPFYPAEDMISHSLDPLRNIIGEPCTVMFRQKSIGSGFGTQFRHVGDIEYWLRILQQGDYSFINEDLASFRKHARGATAANNAQLWLASDIVHLSYAMEGALKKMGKSRHQFVRDALYWLSCALSNLIDTGELSEKKLHKDQMLRREDMFGLKEALFHTMLVLAQSGAGENSPMGILRKELRIRELEADLRRVMATPSWTWTRSLREMNRLISGNNSKTASEEYNLSLDEQEEYIQYLRQSIRRILRSRSWKLTRHLRNFQKQIAPKQATEVPLSKRSGLGAKADSHGRNDNGPATARKRRKKSTLGPRYPNQLVVGAIIQNQAPFLKEWLEFHRLVGVERFYIFDNLSNDDYEAVLQPYIDSGIVKLYSWPVEIKTQNDFNDIQCSVYRRIVDLTAESAKWLALLDVDEFLFPTKEDTLIDLLDEYEEFGGLSVNWQMFGTSNCHKIPADRLSIEMLTRCAEKDNEVNLHVKTISRPELIMRVTNPHFAKYVKHAQQVNEERIPMSGSRTSYVSVDQVRINHYWTRDQHFFETQKLPALKNYSAFLTDREIEERLRTFNATEDLSIQRFVPKLRERMFGAELKHHVTIR